MAKILSETTAQDNHIWETVGTVPKNREVIYQVRLQGRADSQSTIERQCGMRDNKVKKQYIFWTKAVTAPAKKARPNRILIQGDRLHRSTRENLRGNYYKEIHRGLRNWDRPLPSDPYGGQLTPHSGHERSGHAHYRGAPSRK